MHANSKSQVLWTSSAKNESGGVVRCICGWVHTDLRQDEAYIDHGVRTDKSCQQKQRNVCKTRCLRLRMHVGMLTQPQVMNTLNTLLQKQQLCHCPANSPAILASWMQRAMKWEWPRQIFSSKQLADLAHQMSDVLPVVQGWFTT